MVRQPSSELPKLGSSPVHETSQTWGTYQAWVNAQMHDDADDQPPVGKITLESKNLPLSLSLQHPSRLAGISLVLIHINTFNTNKKEAQ